MGDMMGKYRFDAVIFDLDGVVTKTARVHAAAWKLAFDEYLKLRESRDKEPFMEFTHDRDYLLYVDGKPRYEGVRSFLESRHIQIPFGDPSDPPEKETVCGIGNRKNRAFQRVLREEGVELYGPAMTLIEKLKAEGIRVGCATSSKNCQLILQSAGIEDIFETRVDGIVSVQLGLSGKPEGDIFVRAAADLNAVPARTVVVEDANSGVAAGRNGGFGFVVGVARRHNEADLLANGADIAVEDLSQVDIKIMDEWFARKPAPLFDARGKKNLKAWEDSGLGRKGKLVFFLDYDGTLTPIVSRPDLAVLKPEMRDAVSRLSKKHRVAIVSGRMREDVQRLVGIDGLFYAGSHGFDIQGPGFSLVEPKAQKTIPLVARVTEELKKEVGNIKGVLIEEKKFSMAVHYRMTDPREVPHIREIVDRVVGEHRESLRLMCGKMVFEILPNIEWDKGKAIRWIMEALKLDWKEVRVFYIGDDTTDEFAFRTIRTRGTGILVSEENRPSAADYGLSTPEDVQSLFEELGKAG